MLVPFPIVCFIGAPLTDIAYALTADMMWTNFSAWLLAAGIIMGCLAAVAGLVDFIASRRIRAQRPAWPPMLGNVLVLSLALLNNPVHSRGAVSAPADGTRARDGLARRREPERAA